MENAPFKPLLIKLLQDAYAAQQAWWQGLNEEEQTAIGTPEHWAARDHIANLTFWRGRMAQQLIMILQGEKPPAYPPFGETDASVFQQQQKRPLAHILRESDQTQEKLLALVERFSEEDLHTLRQDWMEANDALGVVIMSTGYASPLEHLAQYYLDRDNLAQATRIQETRAEQILQTSVPDSTKGIELYNLACFYAQHNLLDKVLDRLLDALSLYPRLKEWALNDPDLAIVRHQI